MAFWITVLVFLVGIFSLAFGYSLGENSVRKEYTDRMVKFAMDLEYIKSKLK